MNDTWTLCKREIPKKQIIYLTQVVLIYIVVIACIVNLSISENNQSLWASLLSGSIGYLLPSPSFGKKKKPLEDLVDGKKNDVAFLHTSPQ